MNDVSEIMKEMHDNMTKSNTDALTPQYAQAAVTFTLSVGYAGANLEGWITFNDEDYGKIYFRSGKIHEHTEYAYYVYAYPDVKVLVPADVATKGTFSAWGEWVGGHLMMHNDANPSVPIFETRLDIAGAGAGWWSVSGEVNFEKSK